MQHDLSKTRQEQNPHDKRTNAGIAPVKFHITRNLTKCDIV